MPALAGTAAAPSTVDFYVNNALRLSRQVPTGPFDIQDLPVLTGQGELRLVVRDLLGREQVISQSFYAGGGLLAPGLRSYSYEAGFERHNYALRSDDYGPPLLAATERRGLSDTFTGELHAEIKPGQYTGGLGGTWLAGTAGVVTFSMAASHGAAGRGATFGLGFDHRGTAVSFGMRSQWTTRRFAQLGYDRDNPPPPRTASAYLSVGTRRGGSIGLNYTREDFADRQDVRLAGLGYGVQVGGLGYLGLSALRFLKGPAGTLFGLTFTRILGPRDSASIGGRTQGDSRGGGVSFRHGLPVGTGVGYGLQAGLSPRDPDRLDVSMQNDVGSLALEAARADGQDAFRGRVRGSFVLLDGHLFASRDVDDGFAVVQVPGYPNVRVYADNQAVATTDARGYALVPGLRAYEDNPIRIEQADLPMDAQVGVLQRNVVPYRNSGIDVVFPVTRSHGALITIVLPGGTFLPPGALVTVDGNDASFPVGERGEAYVTDLSTHDRLHVRFLEKACDFELSFPETTDPLPHLGPFTCPLE
jgi:outer membrane usher protein